MEDKFTVSLMAEHEASDGVFEDVLLGTYPTQRKAVAAAKAYVSRNRESQAMIIAALPTDPAFTEWQSLAGFVETDDFGSVRMEKA